MPTLRIGAEMTMPGQHITKVVLPEGLFQLAVEKGRSTLAEVAFFMVGLIRHGIAYVYDLVEFDYKEQSLLSVCSGVERELRLAGVLPLGLGILGIMHKHPGSTTPSVVDEELFLSCARAGGQNVFVIYTVRPVRASAYTVVSDEVVEVDCEIRELAEEEKLATFQVLVPLSMRICWPKGAPLIELRAKMVRGLWDEAVKQLGLPVLICGEAEPSSLEELAASRSAEVRPRRPVDVEATWMEGLAYRLYVDQEATAEEILDLIKGALGEDLCVLDCELDEDGKVKLIRVARSGMERGSGAGPAELGGDGEGA